MGHWPEAWARMGDGHTTVSSDPHKALDLAFKCFITKALTGKRTSDDSRIVYVPIEVPVDLHSFMQGFSDAGYTVVGGIQAVFQPDEINKIIDTPWLALSTHTEGYPSGGSVEYAGYAFFNGAILHTSREKIDWQKAQFYRVEAKEII